MLQIKFKYYRRYFEEKAEFALYKTQVTTRSPMGAIIYETMNILIDNGWIRILGSGNEKIIGIYLIGIKANQ